MNLERYEIKFSGSVFKFEFVSSGKNGEILKVVQYLPTMVPNTYNLGFGDKNLKTGVVSDSVTSDNGDGRKVLMTVAVTILKFTEVHPSSQIIATGSSRSRTRLYQIGISNNLSEINKSFDVHGEIDGKWEIFEKGKNYNAFLIKRKK
jgi:hypothetical protein